MKLWTTFVWAFQDGELLLFEGNPIKAVSKEIAQMQLDSAGMGYLSVGDEIIGEQIYSNSYELN